MKMTRRLAARTALIALAIAAVAQTAATQTMDERAVRAASDQWQQDIVAKNVDAIVALHAPDAILMFSHAPLVKGTTAIRDVYSNMVKIPGMYLHWTPTKIVVASPTVATEYGTYSESYDTPQGKASDGGNYVTIWNKINGKWRVALDAPNTTDPPSGTMGSMIPASAKIRGGCDRISMARPSRHRSAPSRRCEKFAPSCKSS